MGRKVLPKKILFVGATYSGHKGSAALVMSSLLSLKREFPDAVFLLFMKSNKNLEANYPGIHVISIRFNTAVELLLGALGAKLSRKSIDFSILKYLKDIDIIVDVSGDCYSPTIYGRSFMFALGCRVFTAKLLDVPIVLYCQSIGPFEAFLDRISAKFFLRTADLVIAREYITANELHKLGIEVPVCADQAFLLEPSPISVPLQLPNKQLIIGLNLSQHIDSLCGGEVLSNTYRQVMMKFIDNIIEKYNARILIIPEVVYHTFCEGANEAYDDYYLSKKIVARLKNPQAVTIVEGNPPPSELKTIAGYCDILISPRFHMVIFALAQNVPSLAIAYSTKVNGIMAMMGQSEYIINYKDLTYNVLVAKTEKLLKNKEEIKNFLRNKMVEMRSRALMASQMTRSLLEERK